MIFQLRKRTDFEDIVYPLHLCFSGLSLRNTPKALSGFVQRSHTAIRDWIQKHQPERLFFRETKVSEFIIDETQNQGWIWAYLVMGCDWIRNQEHSCNAHVKGTEHVCCGAFSFQSCKRLRQTSTFNRWWNMVPSGLQVFETRAPHPFPLWERHHGKDSAVHQGQDGIAWWLLSMQKKELQTKACPTMAKSIC